MAKTVKNRQKHLAKKALKQKRRKEKIKNQKKLGDINQPSVEEIVDFALEKVDEEDWNGAEKVLKKLKTKHNNHPQTQYGLGVLSAVKKNYYEAIIFFKKAVELSPNFLEAHYNLGVAYKEKLNIPGMAGAFKQVVQQGEADNEIVKNSKNFLYTLEKDLKKQDGLSLDDFLKVHDFFDQAVKNMQSKNWRSAISMFQNLISFTKNRTQIYGNLGICYAHLGQRQMALDALDKAIESDPHYELALINRAAIENLNEGEPLNIEGPLKTVDYYTEYPLQNKYFITELAESKRINFEAAESKLSEDSVV